MTALARFLTVLMALALPALAHAQLSLFEHDQFAGREVALDRSVANLESLGFNDRASSVIVRRGRWQLCSDANFRGQCLTLGPGAYPALSRFGMNDQVSSVRGWDDDGEASEWNRPHGAAVLFEHADFRGRAVGVDDAQRDLHDVGFNDRVSSVHIRSGRWQLCTDADFRGQCVVLGPGDYRSLDELNLNDRLSSLRRVGGHGGEGPATALTLFEHDQFGGRSAQLREDLRDFNRLGLNDRVSSLIVEGSPWLLCSDADFRGHCVVLPPGRYRSLGAMGLNDQLSSARPVDADSGSWRSR